MTVQPYLFSIIPSAAGTRLDQCLAAIFGQYSRSFLQGLIKKGEVSINGAVQKLPRYKVQAKDEVSINLAAASELHNKAQDIPLDIVYADADVIVVNKPAGLISHPGAGNPDGTLVNALLHYDASLSALPRAGLIHRLDKDTSGLLIIARNQTAYTRLVEAMQQRDIKRSYFAIVQGHMISGGTVDEPIGRHPKLRTKMAVVASGKEAQTTYRIAEKFRAHTALNLQLHTGRTHQIRVHMQHLRYPLVGDQTYRLQVALPAKISDALKEEIKLFKRQALHAQYLQLQHPITAEELAFSAPIPDDMARLLAALRKDGELHA